MVEPLVRYTGHALVDTGAATLTVLAGKQRPEDLTLDDLDDAAEQMLEAYRSKAMHSYLSVLFPNSAYVNPTMGDDKRKAFVDQYVRAYRSTADLGVRCVFTGTRAQVRIYRQHLPLITGEGLFNFLPGGQAGLPVSGVALLCIQAMPLGTLRSQGRALLVHSSENILTYRYARKFFATNNDAELLATFGKSGPSAKSIVVRMLPEVEESAYTGERRGRAEGVTVYHLTNYGTGANIDIYPLPAFVVDFLRDVQTLPAWNRLAGHYWQVGKKQEGQNRNFLYERVFDLPDSASSFVREFLLGRPRWGNKLGPRASWELVDLFLRKVLNMAESRIEVIRNVANRLAEHIAETTGDARLFVRLFRCNNFRELRWLLLRANERSVKEDKPSVITFDECLELFAISDDLARPDWRLAWDLTLLRLMELLDARDFLKRKEVTDALGNELDSEPQLVGAEAN